MRYCFAFLLGSLVGLVGTVVGTYFLVNADPAVSFRVSRFIRTCFAAEHNQQKADMQQEKPSKPTVPVTNGQEQEGRDLQFLSVEEFMAAAELAAKSPSSSSYADLLWRYELTDFEDSDRKSADNVALGVATLLREQIKKETNVLYSTAVQAETYADAIDAITDAAGILASYPMSDDKNVVKEADTLSRQLNDVRYRVEGIRRAKYNVWAATEIQEGLKTLREGEEGYREASSARIAVIDSSLLDTATSALYGYAIQQLMDEYKAADKANVAKTLNDPSVERRTLEGF